MIFVDGYNVIRRVPSLASAETRGGLAAGRRALLSAIVSSGVLRASRVFVYFDGSSDVEGNEKEPVSHPRLTVRFSRPPSNADSAIVAALEAIGVKEGVSLVTADAELSFRARSMGASVLEPETWVGVVPRRLAKRPSRRQTRGRRADGSEEKPEATKAELDYWRSVFSDAEED